jgi:hypothetical protein
MLSDTIIINKKSLESFSFYPAVTSGFLSGHTMEWPEAYVPGTSGMAVTGPAKLRPRVLRIDGRIDVDTPGALFPAIQALLAHLFFGPLEVTTAHDFDKVYYARVEEQPIVAYEPQMLSTDASLSLSLRCADPMVYDRYATVVGFGATPVPVPMGTGWSSGVLRVNGCSSPAIRVRRGNGLIVQELNLGHSVSAPLVLGANDMIEVDSPGRTVNKTVAGVTTNGLEHIYSGDYPLVISPLDGDAENPPTIEITSGTAELIYRKTYL